MSRGLVDIAISLWTTRDFGRTESYEVNLNGTGLGSLSGVLSDASSRSNRVNLAMNDINIGLGETISLDLAALGNRRLRRS